MDYDTLKKFSPKNNMFVFTMVLYYIVFEKSCSKSYYKCLHRNIRQCLKWLRTVAWWNVFCLFWIPAA